MFAALTLGLAVNQVATGLALTIFGIGLSGLIGAGFVGQRIAPAPHLDIPLLTDLPFVGKILFGQDAFVYFSILLVAGIWWFLYRTRAGLILRAVGDNHASAHALGYPVLKIRWLAVLFGGGCAGLGGAYLPLAYTPFFVTGMTAGPRLDRAGAGGVLLPGGRAAGRRRLSVRCGDDPATARARGWPWHPIAIDVVAALSRLHHRAGADFAQARHRRFHRASRRWAWCSCRIASVWPRKAGTGFRTKPYAIRRFAFP